MTEDKEQVLEDDDAIEPQIKFRKPSKINIKDIWHRISYAIIPFLCIVAAILFSWVANQIFGSVTGFQPNLPIDAHIPYVPQFIIFYFLCFPLCIVAYFVLAYHNRRRLYDITAMIVICYIISGIVYWVWPTEFPLAWKYSWLPENLGFWDKFVYNTWNTGLPTCLLPSQHCFMAIACILTLFDWRPHPVYAMFMVAFNICVVLSTMFLKQHFIMDFVTSLAIMTIVYLLLRLFKFGDRVQGRIDYRKQNKKIPTK